MSRNYKFYKSEAPYFLSFAVVKWLYVFTRNEYKDILLSNFKRSTSKVIVNPETASKRWRQLWEGGTGGSLFVSVRGNDKDKSGGTRGFVINSNK
jgi:hypothetical protein